MKYEQRLTEGEHYETLLRLMTGKKTNAEKARVAAQYAAAKIDRVLREVATHEPLPVRLRTVESSKGPITGITTNWNRNPDGPEAADRIEQLEADNAKLREALEDIERRCSEHDRINLIGKTPSAKKAGTIRNVMLRARTALQETSR